MHPQNVPRLRPTRRVRTSLPTFMLRTTRPLPRSFALGGRDRCDHVSIIEEGTEEKGRESSWRTTPVSTWSSAPFLPQYVSVVSLRTQRQSQWSPSNGLQTLSDTSVQAAALHLQPGKSTCFPWSRTKSATFQTARRPTKLVNSSMKLFAGRNRGILILDKRAVAEN